MLPEHDVAVSILSSGFGTDFSGTLREAIEAVVDLGAPVDAPTFEIDYARFDDHVGSYTDRAWGDMDVWRDGDQLLIEMPLIANAGYAVYPTLDPVSSDTFVFYLDGGAYDLTFLAEGDGPSQWIRNRSFVGIRQVDSVMLGVPPRPFPGLDGPRSPLLRDRR